MTSIATPPHAPKRIVPDLSYLLSHASHALATRMSAATAEIGITPRAFCVLYHALEAEHTQIELAGFANLDKTTMVATVDELERAGLAERRQSSTDRRARIIMVTEAGRRVAAQGMVVVDRIHQEVLDDLPAAERAPFVEALTRLVGGCLAAPVASEQPVRRPRRPRG